MKKLLTLSAIALFATSLPLAAHAQPVKESTGLTGAIKSVIEKVADVFTGDDKVKVDSEQPGAHGRENALEQIEKNIDKHGGEHHGLENARRNVAKGGSSDSVDLDGDETLIEEIVEEIAEGAREEAKKEIDGMAAPDTGHRGKKPSHGKGRN